MLEVLKSLAGELAAGRPAVMAGIIRQDGSAPRSRGARFVVTKERGLTGSIGGGALEAQAIEAAMELIGTHGARVLQIRLTGQEVAETDMICGGNVDVLVHAFSPGRDSDRRVLDAALRLMERGGRGVLIQGPLPAPDREGDQTGFRLWLPEEGGDDEALTRGLSGDVLRAAAAALDEGGATIASGADGDFYLEPMASNPTVIIFGGGHISVNLAPLLSWLGFRVVVMDDREEFASAQRFPTAEKTLVCAYKDCFDHLEFTPETYEVIVTRGHLYDKDVLQGCLARPFRYVGMIGSKRKRNMIYQALLDEGTSRELIEAVHSPIGLPIGGETPEEIAVSIAAELIQVRGEALRLVKNWKV